MLWREAYSLAKRGQEPQAESSDFIVCLQCALSQDISLTKHSQLVDRTSAINIRHVV